MATTPQPDPRPSAHAAVVASLNADSWFSFLPEGDDLPVHVRVGRQPTGRHVCTGLVVGDFGSEQPREVNAAALRSVRMPQLIRAILQGDGEDPEGDETAIFPGALPDSDDDRHRKAVLDFTDISTAPARPPGRGGYPPEFYRHIADAYRYAMRMDPNRPTTYLREHFYLAENERLQAIEKLTATGGVATDDMKLALSTLRRWRARAEKDGYLTEVETDR